MKEKTEITETVGKNSAKKKVGYPPPRVYFTFAHRSRFSRRDESLSFPNVAVVDADGDKRPLSMFSILHIVTTPATQHSALTNFTSASYFGQIITE